MIVDDASYLEEPFFQDGPIANAANVASTAGVSYFSAAGNANVIVGGHNVSSYQAQYRSTACPTGTSFDEPLHDCHNFDPNGGTSGSDQITLAPGGGFALDLQWAQPWGGVTTDLDAFVINASGTVVAESEINNLASQEPFEILGYQNTTATSETDRIVIGRYAGNQLPTLKFIFAGSAGITGVQFNTSTGGDIIGPSIFGHNGTTSVGTTGRSRTTIRPPQRTTRHAVRNTALRSDAKRCRARHTRGARETRLRCHRRRAEQLLRRGNRHNVAIRRHVGRRAASRGHRRAPRRARPCPHSRASHGDSLRHPRAGHQQRHARRGRRRIPRRGGCACERHAASRHGQPRVRDERERPRQRSVVGRAGESELPGKRIQGHTRAERRPRNPAYVQLERHD